MKHTAKQAPGLTSYTRGCRCADCREAWRNYQRVYMNERYHGKLRLVNPKRALEHIALLEASGMSRSAIAAAAGVDHLVLKRIVLGRQKSLNRSSEDKILSVPIGMTLPGRRVPAHRAVTLMDAMHEAGVPVYELKERLHIASPSNIRKQESVRPWTWARLAVFYRYLATQGRVPASLLDEVDI